MHRDSKERRAQRGHLLIGLMVAIAVMVILLSAAAEKWSTILRRDREEELIFRGQQYADAITAYQREQGGLPTELEVLIKKGPKGHRYIRRLFKDPFSKDGKWGRLILAPGAQAVVNPMTQEMRPVALLQQKGLMRSVGGQPQPLGPQTPQDFGLRALRGSQRFPGRGQAPAPSGETLFRASVTQVSPFPPEQLVGGPIAGVVSANLRQKAFKIYEGYEWIRDFWFTAFLSPQGPAQPPSGGEGYMPPGFGPGQRIQGFGGSTRRPGGPPGRMPGPGGRPRP